MKKVRLKRDMAILLCILCFVIMSAGCKQAKNEGSQDKEKINVVAKNSWYSNVDLAESKIVNAVVDNSGYQVNWKLNATATYNDTVRNLLLEKNPIGDIVQLPDLDEYEEYIHAGDFICLDEYLDVMPNLEKYLEDNPDIKASLTAEDGHIYYVPQTVITENYQPCIMYNMEWMDKLGLQIPTTLEQFVDVLKAFKNNDMNGNGAMDEIPMSITADFLPYMFGPAFGLELVNGFYADDDRKVHYSYSEDNYKKYLAFLNELYNDGLLEPGYSSLTRDEIMERCRNNQTGIIFDFSWNMSANYSAQYAEYDGSTPIFCGAQPLSGEYQGYYIGRNEISGLFGVMTSSSKIMDSVKFLDYTLGEEAQQYYCWGIEGESYITDSNGKKQFTQEASDDTWLQKLGINLECLPSRQSVEAVDAHLPKWHVEIDKKLVKYIKKPFPFMFATVAETQIEQGYTNNIENYVKQQEKEFISGMISLDLYDNYLGTLKNMKIDNVVAVKQEQYNRHRKAYR